ncbi:MAG: hypothetical protein EBX19_07835, partial [Actinobacteria bacterium]|nr:hypothetical protein [Actinomycetota bacterium]
DGRHADAENVIPLVPEFRGQERADGDRPQQDDEGGQNPKGRGGAQIHHGERHRAWMQGLNKGVKRN